ncbi:MAG: hypothetical protein JRN06_10270 [Nitrososphaerota archaeon]|nr:hypothetical protein [Nitrososphaerota archaeon]
MPKGIWVWPADSREQRAVLRKTAASPHLMAAMSALAKSKEGMSNAELDDAINDSAEWTTLWVVRQLTALGFVEFKVDFFGNPNRYQLTDQGWSALSSITGKPAVKPAPPAPVAPPQATPAKPAQPATPATSATPTTPPPTAQATPPPRPAAPKPG